MSDERLKSRPEMTARGLMAKVYKIASGMKEGEISALQEMRNLLVRRDQDENPVDLPGLRREVSPGVLSSLFVTQKILMELDENFGVSSSIGIPSDREIYLINIARSLGKALEDSYFSYQERGGSVLFELGAALGAKGMLVDSIVKGVEEGTIDFSDTRPF